jgi:hypothetical protein
MIKKSVLNDRTFIFILGTIQLYAFIKNSKIFCDTEIVLEPQQRLMKNKVHPTTGYEGPEG